MNHLMKLLPGLVLAFLSLSLQAQQPDKDEALPPVHIERVENLQSLGEQARREGKIILLEIEASDCPYCRRLEEEILKPMLRSGDYEDNTLIRQMEIDGQDELIDWDGNRITPTGFSRRYGIFVTPTLLFLAPDGVEVSKRMLGINSVDYFGAYVDEALEQGRRRIARTEPDFNLTATEKP